MFKKIRKALVASISPNSRVSEQYRTIRTNLYFSSMDTKDQIYLITSPSRREGKTTTSVNLAISLAQKGEKVLLVDADLRKPNIHTELQLTNERGLSTILMSKQPFQDIVQSSGVENLYVLTSGPIPSQSADVLGSEGMRELLDQAAKQYDKILIDSSPVLEFTDARVLAHQCQGTLLVLRNGKTLSDKALEAKRLLELARVKIRGVIFSHR